MLEDLEDARTAYVELFWMHFVFKKCICKTQCRGNYSVRTFKHQWCDDMILDSFKEAPTNTNN